MARARIRDIGLGLRLEIVLGLRLEIVLGLGWGKQD